MNEYRWIGIVMAALIMTSAAPARAEKPSNADIVKAKQLYKSARERKQAGDDMAARGQMEQARAAYGQAAKDYLEAHRLTHLPAFLYNLGSIYRLRGEKQWALRCYRAFLVSEPEDENDIRDALTFINELKKELRDQPPGVSSEPALEPAGVCMESEKPEDSEAETGMTRPIETTDKSSPPAGSQADSTHAGPAGAANLGKDAAAATQERPGRGYRLAFWATAGVTVASGVVAGVTHYQVTHSLEDNKDIAIADYESMYTYLDTVEACGDAETRLGQAAGDERARLQDVVDACDTGKSRATLSNIMQGVTVVGLLATGFLFYKGYMGQKSTTDTPHAARLTPLLGPTAIGAELTLDF